MPQFVCIGVPYYIGEHFPERREVEKIKASGIAEELDALWVDLQPDFDTAPDAVTAVNRALAAVIAYHADRVPLVFADDCCAALGAMKGLERHDPAIVWYDAHGDFNTPETTLSGFLGGMPLAWLVGRGDMRYMRGVDLTPIDERDIIITDARDLDPEEGVNLRESDITLLTNTRDLLTAPLPQKPLYLHFDTDIVRLDDMPGMNYPAEGGPSLDDCVATVQRLAREGQAVGLLFSLWNDALVPDDDRSLNGVLRLTRAFAERAQS